MTNPNNHVAGIAGLRLRSLPIAARYVLTLFVVVIGAGYLMAVGNLYQRHQLADEQRGLSMADLKVTFHGAEVEARSSGRSKPREHVDGDVGDGESNTASSRMLEVVLPGGEMRKELIKGGEEAVRSLVTWLEEGAARGAFEKQGLVQAGDPSPAMVITRYCLRCHNAEDGEKQDTPYGPDMFEVDYDMVAPYALPGTAKHDGADADSDTGGMNSNEAVAAASEGKRVLGPQSLPHLFLVSHIHMLAIPMYTLVMAVLVLMSGLPRGFRGVLAGVPMTAASVDFLCWWLARVWEPAVYVIPAAGAVYGVGLAVQVVVVLWGMWIGGGRIEN